MSTDRERARRRPAVLCAAGAACVLLLTSSACSRAGSGGAGAAASPAGPASYNELAQAFVEYAQCARTHGMPDLPDPVVDQMGNDTYPPLATTRSPRWPQSVLTGCASVWAHVHAVRDRYDASHGLQARARHSLSPAQALAYSQCVRLHGFPGYPDPGPDGTVHNQPPGFQKPNLSAAAISAITTCTTQVERG